jgi:hypothetical protein
MQLASDAVDRNGQLLAKAGKELTDQELRLFKIWGVQGIEIVCGDESAEEVQEAAQDMVIEPQHAAAARELFRHCDLEHPVVAKLLDECARRIAARG